MNNFKLYHLLPVLLICALISACDHETDEFDGPFLVDRFGEFTVVQGLGISQPTVDFAAGETVFFTAEFNKNVNWIIQITGMESGAVKRIEGFDRSINAGNATWTGGTTDLPVFKAENCMVELLVPEEPDFMDAGEVEVISAKIYEGGLVTDFETDPGADIFFGNFEFELSPESGRRDDIPAAQGDTYYLLRGTDNSVPNFFVGLMRINASITGETYMPFPTTVPEELYFNCFMYSDGSPHTIAVIQFSFDSNDNGVYDDGIDANFQVPGDFPLTWEGWRHINHPLSEVGITQEQLEKIVAVRFLLISDMNSQPDPPVPVDYCFDFVTFTAGGPLEL